MTDFTKPIRYFTITGAAWTTVAFLWGFLAQLVIVLQIPVDTFVGYGILRPLFTQTLIFGALLSFIFAGGLYLIGKEPGSSQKWPVVSLVVFGLQNAAVLFGTLTILVGANKGREYGEYTFLSDGLIELSLIVFLVHALLSVKRGEHASPALTLLFVALAGTLATFILGNFSFPYRPLSSVPLHAGLRDAAVQEYYRTALLGFLIAAPTFALLYHVLPAYTKLPLFSESMVRFQAAAILLLAPLAGGAGLVHSAAPAGAATLGIFLTMSLCIALIAGTANLTYTVSRAATITKPDRLLYFANWFIRGIFVLAVLRAVTSVRGIQQWMGLTTWNGSDIGLDAIAALFGLFAAAVYAFQVTASRTIPSGMLKLQIAFGAVGFLAFGLGSIIQSFVQAAHLADVTETGDLAVTAWDAILYAGNPFQTGPANASFSLRGMILLGSLLLLLSGLTGFVNLIRAALAKSGSFSLPDLNGGPRTYGAKTQAHGAHS